MKKRLFAAILAAMMLASTSAIAFAEDVPAPSVSAGTAFGEWAPDVDTEAQAATIEFSVPTSLTVGLDPFQAGDDSGSQVYSNAQGIYNKSNIPIRVTVKAGAIIGKDTDGTTPLAVLKDDPADVTSSDITDTDKNAYIELIAEKATATTDRSGAVVIETTKLEGKDYATAYAEDTGADTTAKAIVKEATATTTGTGDTAVTTITYDEDSQISFALQAATYAVDRSGAQSFSALAENNKGVAAFRFMGSLNANAADWSGDDISVKVVYSVNGMGTAAYTALIGDNAPSTVTTDMKDANVYSVGAPAGGSQTTEPSIDASSGTEMDFTTNANGSPLTIKIANLPNGWTVTKVELADDINTTAAQLDLTDDYTVNADTVTIIGGTTGKGICKIDTSATEATFTITLSDGGTGTKVLTHKITVTNS